MRGFCTSYTGRGGEPIPKGWDGLYDQREGWSLSLCGEGGENSDGRLGWGCNFAVETDR
jgi:hypothetical protein